ncbi:hypothetical protein [Galbibacter sp.]|uniref:hypothetical protein n=1 Tax=Galbibacter sp. TaxID=2918471 RepID=UPI002C6D373C|nr:hypothetical protein [Galbibacter sp.]HLV63583.1 hypothetical protein [Galbibacter sp.]
MEQVDHKMERFYCEDSIAMKNSNAAIAVTKSSTKGRKKLPFYCLFINNPSAISNGWDCMFI